MKPSATIVPTRWVWLTWSTASKAHAFLSVPKTALANRAEGCGVLRWPGFREATEDDPRCRRCERATSR